MKRRVILSMLIVLLTIVYTSAQAQKVKSVVITADSLATGNYKDVFKSFFQLAFDRFTSNNKDIQFSSNPFAIMARANPELLVDTSYLRYTALRNLNFSFSARLDTSYKFNGFSSGITYALINRRDETVSRYFLAQAYDANKEFSKLFPFLTAFVTTIQDTARRNKINSQINAFFDGSAKFNELDAELQEKIKTIAVAQNATYLTTLLKKDPKLNLGKLIRANYDSVKTDFQNRLLLTVGISDTTYKDQFMFSNVVLKSNLVKGITNPTRVCGLELNIKAAYQFVNDTLMPGRDLKRQVFTFEPGVNLIIKTKRGQKPWAEFILSGGYTHLNRLYAGERKDSVTVNGALRIRVFDDIWIPLEIKYDPRGGNLFGFLNVRANFKGQKKPGQ